MHYQECDPSITWTPCGRPFFCIAAATEEKCVPAVDFMSTLVEVCPPLGEGSPNVGRALGCTHADNLKTAPTCSQSHAVGTLDHVGTTMGRV